MKDKEGKKPLTQTQFISLGQLALGEYWTSYSIITNDST